MTCVERPAAFKDEASVVTTSARWSVATAMPSCPHEEKLLSGSLRSMLHSVSGAEIQGEEISLHR